MEWQSNIFKKRNKESEVSSNETTQPYKKDGDGTSMESESEIIDFETVLRQLTSRVRREIYQAQKELMAELINAAGVTMRDQNGYSLTPMRMSRMMENGTRMPMQQAAFISDHLNKLYFSMSILEKIEEEKGLLEIDPADVESLVGLKYMGTFRSEAEKVGWGTEEYWTNLFRVGAEADRNLCLGLCLSTWENILKECQKIEEEYGQNPENFEDVTIYKNGVPFTRLAPILDIDITFACDILKRVERYLEDGEGDINDLAYFGYGDDIEGLFYDGIYLVRSKKIAVKRR